MITPRHFRPEDFGFGAPQINLGSPREKARDGFPFHPQRHLACNGPSSHKKSRASPATTRSKRRARTAPRKRRLTKKAKRPPRTPPKKSSDVDVYDEGEDDDDGDEEGFDDDDEDDDEEDDEDDEDDDEDDDDEDEDDDAEDQGPRLERGPLYAVRARPARRARAAERSWPAIRGPSAVADLRPNCGGRPHRSGALVAPPRHLNEIKGPAAFRLAGPFLSAGLPTSRPARSPST